MPTVSLLIALLFPVFSLVERTGNNSPSWEWILVSYLKRPNRTCILFSFFKNILEEQFNNGLSLEQKTLAGSIQRVTLVSVTKAVQPVKVQRPKVIENLSYTFDPQEQRLQKEGRVYSAFYPGAEAQQSYYYSQNSDESESNEQDRKYYSPSEGYYAPSEGRGPRRPRSLYSQESGSEESEETRHNDAAWFHYVSGKKSNESLDWFNSIQS